MASTSITIDQEWTKFMTKLNKQGDCDNSDEDDEDDIEEVFNITNTEFTAHRNASQQTSSGANKPPGKHSGNNNNTAMNANGGTVGKVVPPKRTCISKKQQRKTYSFIDALEVPNDGAVGGGGGGGGAGGGEEEAICHVATTATGATAATGASSNIPKSTPIYISTKTKIAYLNKKVDIYSAFWDVPVVHYYSRREAVIKKQIKFQTTNPADITVISDKLKQQDRYYEEQIIEHIDNPNGRIVFKDQRKVSIGICKKDLLNNNSKKKRAFFNCFVLILRINGGICTDETVKSPVDNILFKEMHVKVFNTGKLEIPGIQDDRTLIQVLDLLVKILRPVLGEDLNYQKERCETVLINSNFNCGYYINRDKLFHLMKYKYRINSNYDSCSYPGIQCKFYYIPGETVQTGQQPTSLENQKYYELSFMIFRTGSILIVGKCNDSILMQVYIFIKKILEDEFHIIQMGLVETHNTEQSSTLSNGGGAIADADADPDADPDADGGIAPETFAIKPVKKSSKARRKIIMLGNIEPFHFT